MLTAVISGWFGLVFFIGLRPYVIAKEQLIPLKIGDFHQPLSSSDIGRGFKLNVAAGEDIFKKKVFDGEIEVAPMTGSTTISTIVTDTSKLEEAMEISGRLGVSYGPMISGEGSGRYVENTVSSARRAIIVYRTRHTAFFKRLKPGTLTPVKDVDENGSNVNYLADTYGTKFVDTVVYGAQLDVTFSVTATEDIDMDEIEAELKGKIGIGLLSVEFEAKFKKGSKNENARYNMDIHAEANGVLMTIPANPTFKQVSDIIKDFNDKYEDKFQNFIIEGNPLLEQIEPVGFRLSSIADRIKTLNKMEVSLLEDRMGDLEKAFRKTMFWKAKLNAINSDLVKRYERNHKLRVEMYNPYIRLQTAAMLLLNKNVDSCLLFRAKSFQDVINTAAIDVPKAYPSAGSPEEDMFRGLSGEYYIQDPVKIGNDKPLQGIYYIGFALKIGNHGTEFVPWMHGTLKRARDDSIVATAETPEELANNAKLASLDPTVYRLSKVWKGLGKLGNYVLEDKLKEFPPTHYEYGATFNNINVLPCTINGWNGETRYVSITTPYLQGDDGSKLWFGSSVSSRGTRDERTQKAKKTSGEPEFVHTYVDFGSDGSFGYHRGWQSDRHLSLYVRPFPFPWVRVGFVMTVSSFYTFLNKYPSTSYAWGTDYNGVAIREITMTTWNHGLRIHTKVPYPQGDVATSLKFGVASFTTGTTDAQSKLDDRFYHRYIHFPGASYAGSNGLKNIPLYVRKLGNDW